MSCTTSSTIYDRCPETTTTNCISYEGDSIECLGICKGDCLTQVEMSIANSICSLITATNVTSIVVPDCLKTAFGTKDETILNFIDLLLQNACEQQNNLDNLNSLVNNINPYVTVDYSCCSDNPCVTTGTVRLNVALQNIISCICDLKSYVGNATLPNSYSTLSDMVVGLNATITAQQQIINQLNTTIASILLKTECLPNC